MALLDAHRTAEQRSLAYHQRIAEKILADPTVCARAQARLKAQLEAEPEGATAPYAHAWLRLLDGTIDEIVAFITSDTQVAKDLRQASPFAGALDPRERWAIWRQAGASSSYDRTASLGPR